MGLYERPKSAIVATIQSLLTPTQIRMAQNEVKQNKESMARHLARMARNAEFAARRNAGV